MAEMQATPPKKSRVWVWALLIALIILFASLGACVYWFANREFDEPGYANSMYFPDPSNLTVLANTDSGVDSEPVNEDQIDDSQLAQALLTSNETVGIDQLGAVRPSLIELNDHLDDTPPETYDFYVARSWFTQEGDLRLSTALVKNDTAELAQNFITVRAADKSLIVGAEGLGDLSVMYYEAAQAGVPASMTVRFTLNTIAAKVQVFATDSATVSDQQLQAELTPVAIFAAQSQLTRLQNFLAGKLPEIEQTSAYLNVPRNLSGATLVGTVPVTEEEWLGATGEYAEDADVAGVVNAAMSRFSLTSRPDEVIEVTVLEFLSSSLAQSFRDQLLSNLSAEGGEEIQLAGEVAEAADAIAHETLVESQIVVDHYVIDLTIFAPLGEFDQEAAEAELVTLTQEVFNNFNPQ